MKKILYLDDSRAALLLGERLLRDVAEVILVSTMEEARQAMYAHDIDLYLLDYILADGNGIEFAREIRKKPGCDVVPIVLLTASYTNHIAYLAMNSGVNQSIRKPVNPVVFRKAVSEQMANPFVEKVELTSLSIDCLAWEADGTFCQFNPHLNELVKDSSKEGAKVAMSELLSKKFTADPDAFNLFVTPKISNHCVTKKGTLVEQEH